MAKVVLNNAVTITRSDLLAGLRALRGAKFVTARCLTVPDMYVNNPLDKKVRNPWFGTITKESSFNGQINWLYENAVNAQRLKEGKEADFESQPRPWGNRVLMEGKLTPLIEHKDSLYVEFRILQVYQTEYFYNGNPIQKEAFEE